MDLYTNKKLLKGKNNSSTGEAEDRISELPDAIVHYILSFLEFKLVVRTCILSKRWNALWASIPILKFPYWSYSEPPSLFEINKFMDFVDRTLLHHYESNIQIFDLETNKHMNASRVHSWISYITKRNVKQLGLCLRLDKPFVIPSSLFKCESLTKLELSTFSSVHAPKSFSFPKLKSLELCRIQFSDDSFISCPVLEKLTLENCTWSGVRKFCILTPALKKIDYSSDGDKEDGLQDCHLKIHAPSLVSLVYTGNVAKDYDLSSFVKLNIAEVYFDATREPRIGHGAAISKFLRALSHVKSLLVIDAPALEALSDVDDLINNLPTFHDLNELSLFEGPTTDKLIFALLKASPNLRRLDFDEATFIPTQCTLWSIDDEKEYDESEGFLQHLQSVHFRAFIGERKEMRWAEVILKNAHSLQEMTIAYCANEENKEMVISELSSLARASGRCVLKLVSNL